MSKENRVSDERMAEMLLVIGEPIEQLSISLPSTDLHLALTELQSLRSKPVAGVTDEIRARVLGRIEDYQDMPPEEDETWESWYYAAFHMLHSSIAEILSNLSLPAQEPVAWRREYADPHYQSEVTQWKETADVWVEDGFTVTPLYASPQPEAVITEEMVERAARALHANSKGKHNHFLPFEDLSAQRILWLREDARAALTAALKEA